MSAQVLSLWEIMQPIFATNISSVFAEITQLAQVASTAGSEKDGVPAQWRIQIAESNMLTLELLCTELDLYQSLEAAQRLVGSLRNHETVTNSELQWRLNDLRELMECEMRQHLYFRVEDRLTRYLATKFPFGEEVDAAFPSVSADIREAGRCIAFGCNAAAAFHLMRVAEVGLWALGRDRQIQLAVDGKIEFSEWGIIIRQLEDAVKAIQQWSNSALKEEAHRFYNHAVVEIRAFNDGWRRHAAHVRPDMPPMSPEEALALWGHVERFMKTLAERISERNAAPLEWK